MPPDEAWTRVSEGNARFADGRSAHPNTGTDRRDEVVSGQHPFAVVLSCSDSRVPIERVLDAGIGDIFAVRVAGNAASGDLVLGSLEYAVLHAGARLVLVIGHESCGAVTAALDRHREPGTSIEPMLSRVAVPGDHAATASAADRLAAAVEHNVMAQIAALLRDSPAIAAKTEAGEVKVVGGVYALRTGRISWLR